MNSLLRVDASARAEGSRTRALLDGLENSLAPAEIIRRDLTAGVPLINDVWLAARDTPADRRTDAQRAALAWSDAAIDEINRAEIVAIGLPVYNFGPPAVLKAWIDQVARPRVTFRYTRDGPVGLLTSKRAFVAFAAGGTKFKSEIDFAAPSVEHILGFVGIRDVTFLHDEADIPRRVAA